MQRLNCAVELPTSVSSSPVRCRYQRFALGSFGDVVMGSEVKLRGYVTRARLRLCRRLAVLPEQRVGNALQVGDFFL